MKLYICMYVYEYNAKVTDPLIDLIILGTAQTDIPRKVTLGHYNCFMT